QPVIGPHVDLLVFASVFFEADQIIEVDVVQVEFEVMIMIIDVVIRCRNTHQRRVRAAVRKISRLEFLRINPSADLEKTQLLVTAYSEGRADTSVRHDDIPTVEQQVVEYPRHVSAN